jgi:hypothetical protein
MNIVEENLKKILNDIKNSVFSYEIPKKELIKIINKYSLNPYGYFNRLWADNYIKCVSTDTQLFQIITLEFKEEETEDTNVIKED